MNTVRRFFGALRPLMIAAAVMVLGGDPAGSALAAWAEDHPEAKAVLTFADCYALAIHQSETLAIHSEVIREADARFLRALGTALPHVDFVSTMTQAAKGGSIYNPPRSTEHKFVITQTIFQGFREFAAMSGTRSEHDQRLSERIRAEELLQKDVANAFFLLEEERHDLRTLARTKRAYLDRIRELKDRERLGRSRPSEVANAQAQLYAVVADQETVKGAEVVARDLLEFLVGRNVGELEDNMLDLPSLEPMRTYIEKTVTRSDVKAAEAAWHVAKKVADIAAGAFIPTVDLQHNRYLQRSALQKNVDWDLMVIVDAPIFEGTETIGSFLEERAKARAAEWEYRLTRRRAIQELKDTYVRYYVARRQVKALQRSLAAARKNYQLQKADYLLSLVNNLDVLQSIQTLEEAQRGYIRALYSAKRLYWQFRAAIGETIPHPRPSYFGKRDGKIGSGGIMLPMETPQ